MPQTIHPIAYSYLRYSSDPQGDGDSINRQTTLSHAWCEKNHAQLDSTRTMADRGISAYRGKHRQRGALAAFLADIEAERIPRGSVLLIENMDRLTRERPVVAVNLLTSILLAGIRVVQLSPDEIELSEDSDLFTLFRGQLAQSRGHDESKTKTVRGESAWKGKKQLARSEGAIVTRRLPAWVQEKNGKLVPVPQRVKLVRKFFDLTIKGNGLWLIVKHLTEQKVPTWGRAKDGWSKTYIHKILTGKVVLGEYQPRKAGPNTDANGKAKSGHIASVEDGDPILGYYPPVIDQETWEKANLALSSRSDKPGRIGTKTTNLFTGLLKDAKTRSPMRIATQGQGNGKSYRRIRTLISAAAMDGRASSTSFPYSVFEEALLSKLREINPDDVICEEPESESVALTEEVAAIDRKVKTIQKQLLEGEENIPALVSVLKSLDEKKQDRLKQLTLARQAEANPRSEVWSEAKSLLEVAHDKSHRLRLRELMSNIIEDVWVLIVPLDEVRVASVQIFFRGNDKPRCYLIALQRGRVGRPASWFVFSTSTQVDNCDLRTPNGVAKTEKFCTDNEKCLLGNQSCQKQHTE